MAIATGTASGKSLCYQAPIAESIVERPPPGHRPAALPHQGAGPGPAAGAHRSSTIPKLVAATYDGDCSPEERTWVRAHANVVLTNPEMLHHGILPHHARWATFLMRLRYVVIDELHLLRGIFGIHVAHLLRRLRRLCHRYGSDPTFVFSSATIGEPGRLASRAVRARRRRGHRRRLAPRRAPVRALEPAGASSPRSVAVPARAATTTRPSGRADRRGRPAATCRTRPARTRASAQPRDRRPLVAELVRRGHRTIAFCRSRKGTEIVAADASRRLPAELADLVRPYRAGYLTAERREIEAELFAGRLRGVVATTALELGVDIGGLDACVLNGFPGTIASMWQQAGRAGRERQQSLAVLVAGDDQLDQWLHAPPRRGLRPRARAGGHQPRQPVRRCSPTWRARPTSRR